MKPNGEFKIEKNIPLPKPFSYGYSSALRKLKVGESVELPTGTANATNIGRQIYGSSGHFSCRKTEKGTRVWRIK